MSLFSEIRSSRELLINLTAREIKGQYKSTFLGQLWSLLNPISQMILFTVMFSFILRIDPGVGDPSGLHSFAIWLMCGLLPWTFFINVAGSGMGSLAGNANLIQKVYFPRITLPMSMAASRMYAWLIEMGVLTLAILIFGGKPLLWLPAALVMMLLLGFFSLGFSLILATLNTYFRDVQHLMGIVFQAWFYLTPIVYPIRILEGQVVATFPAEASWIMQIYRLNPLERFSEVFRNLLYDNRWPSLPTIGICVAWTLIVLVLGIIIFRKNEKNLAENL
jgi:ABC-2 type transport system permease protein